MDRCRYQPGQPQKDNVYVSWDYLFGAKGADVRYAQFDREHLVIAHASARQTDPEKETFGPSDVAVGPSGEVWVAWRTNTIETTGTTASSMRGSPDGAPGNFGSELAPFPAGTARVITVNDAGNLSASNTRITGLLSWLQGASQPRILVDPIDPANIYVISADDPDNQYTNTTDWSNIVMTTSHDFGVTWGAPETISHDPGTAIQIMPAAAIDQQGNIALTWYDTRNQIAGTNSIGKDGIPGTSDDGDLLLDVYATFGSRNADGSHTFLPNDFRLSDVSFDPEPFTVDQFPGSNVLRIGEYNGLAASNGEAFAVWTGNSYVDNSPSFPTVGGQRLIFDTFAMGVVSKIDGLSSKATLGFTTDQAPALASNNGFMYLAFRGETDDHLYLARKNPDAPADSTDWGGAFDTGQTTDAAPALVSVDGNLFLAWTGTDRFTSTSPRSVITAVARLP